MRHEIEAGPRMAPPAKLRLGALHSWVRNTKPGARIAYHVGDLAKAREHYLPLQLGDKHPKRTETSDMIHRQALAAFQYAEDGVLVLCQLPVRREDGKRGAGYHYIAVRTDKPLKEKTNG